MKNIIFKVKNRLDGIKNWLDIVEEKIRVIVIIKNGV